MRILAVDVGTGTQDILLFDSELEIENCFKLVMPSPTMMVARAITEATRRGDPLLLTGVTMGGGPSAWAARDHAGAGHPAYATPDAARSFNDDLDVVQAEMGIELVGPDEVAGLAQQTDVRHVELKDFDFSAIARAFEAFGLDLSGTHGLNGVAAAVFDHGAAPPGYSDRQFRFDYLAERLGQKENRQRPGGLSNFAFQAHNIPPIMTRMEAVARSFTADGPDLPLIVMDTAPAAILGALLDRRVGQQPRLILANVGNFHTLAFRLGPERIEGLFEHHTGPLDRPRLDDLIGALAQAELTHQEVFEDHGHGALLYTSEPMPLDLVAIIGPRRRLMQGSRHAPYFAVPYGDMMLAGCFGLVRACADRMPEWTETILASLGGTERGAPWETLS